MEEGQQPGADRLAASGLWPLAAGLGPSLKSLQFPLLGRARVGRADRTWTGRAG